MRKILLTFISALTGLSMLSSAHAACNDVTVAEMNWASGAIATAVAAFILENGYGCNVTKVPTSTVPSVASVAETGKPDWIIELWVNSAPKYKELESQGKVRTASQVFTNGGEEAWWIPTYIVEANPGLNLDTIEGVLANPDVVGGRFHNCPVGWGCRTINDNLKVALDLEGNGFEVFDHGSGETLAASIAEAFNNKKPWFGYYWGPTAILGKYPMTKVKLGPVDQKAHSCNIKPDCSNPGVSSYPPSLVINVVTTDLEKREPDVAEFASKFVFPNDVLSQMLSWNKENNASPDEAAAYFLSNHKDIWVSWLNDDAKSKLGNLIN